MTVTVVGVAVEVMLAAGGATVPVVVVGVVDTDILALLLSSVDFFVQPIASISKTSSPAMAIIFTCFIGIASTVFYNMPIVQPQ
jgi:hypothetical protein